MVAQSMGRDSLMGIQLPTFKKPNQYFLLSVKYVLWKCAINASDNDFMTHNGIYADTSGLDFTLQGLVFLVEFD